MIKQIILDGRTIEYTVNVSRRTTRIRVSAFPGGEIRVSVPNSLPVSALESFLQKKKKWILSKHDYLKQFPAHVKDGNAAEYKKRKAEALALAKERLAHFNLYYGLVYHKVTIKNHKSLWGSCSRRGNLNFNYKIALLKPEARDYIIVHELCHLKEFNHSDKFWALVSQTIPNYKQIRLTLKKFGMNME